MLRSHLVRTNTFVRFSLREGNKRFMQMISLAKPAFDITPRSDRWAKHSLTFPVPETKKTKPEKEQIAVAIPPRVARTARFRKDTKRHKESKPEVPKVEVAPAPLEAEKTKPKRRALKPRKALITLSQTAVQHLRALLDQPEPQLIRIGVKNRGCSGLTYHLEYVSEPGKFDELVEQDGVKVLIDLKALFSIVGLEMDWLDDKLLLRFVFKNPNSKGTCGCGESFMV